MTQNLKNIPVVLNEIFGKYDSVRLEDIDYFFSKISKVLKINPSEIVSKSGYNIKELKDERHLNSFFAELRSVLYLHNNEFSDISFIPRLANKSTPDITAYFGTMKFAVEVYCRQTDSFLHPIYTSRDTLDKISENPNISSIQSGEVLRSKLDYYLTEEVKDKKKQIDYGFSKLK